MNIERIKTIIEAYGADPVRWPHDERTEAIAIVEGSHELEELVEDARRLDATLDEIAPTTAPSALRERILANVARGSVRGGTTLIDRFLDWLVDGTPWDRVLRPVMASLPPLLLGFAVGAYAPVEGADELLAQSELAAEVAELAFVDTELLEPGP